jgi:excisionase family DNA binding protein
MSSIEDWRDIVRKRFLSPEEVSLLLGCSPKTVRRYCKTEALPAEKLGGRWYISTETFKGHAPLESGPESDARFPGS